MKKNITKRFFSLMLSVALVFAMMPMGVFATTGTSAPESADGVYQLKTADDLYWFAGLVNGSLSDVEQDVNASAVICNDIQVNVDVLDEEGGLNPGTYKAWIPMGSKDAPYTGSFDGAGYTISGLYYSDTTVANGYVGYFGYCGAGSNLTEVTIENSYFNGNGYVGALAGYTEGDITNCCNKSTVIASSSKSSTSDVGAGGIVGLVQHKSNGKDISGCVNYGSITSVNRAGGIVAYCQGEEIAAAVNYGSVSGQTAGGICGTGSIYNNSRLHSKNLTNYGVIKANLSGGAVGGIFGTVLHYVEYCVNKGVVSGFSCVGGIVGKAAENTLYVQYCTNEGNVTGTSKVGGIMGSGSDQNHNSVQYAINKGTVKSTATENKYTGGILGDPTYYFDQHRYTSSVSNTYNIGKVINGNNILGYDTDGTCEKNYYDSDLLGLTAGKYPDQEGTPMTTAQFKSGEVAYLLGSQNGYFRQNLTGNVDAYPTLDQTHKVVYKVSTYDCDGQLVGDVTYKNNSTDAQLSHEYGEPTWTWADNCKEAFAKFACENYDTHIETVDATISEEEKAGTCKQPAKTVYTATVAFNGKTYTDTKEVAGEYGTHKWETEYTVDEPATCTKAGSKSYHCSVCDASDEYSVVAIKKADHKFEEKVMTEASFAKAATCAENAKYYFSCTCGEISKDKTFEKPDSKLKHSYTDACDAVCNECEDIRPIAHSWEAATCTTPKTCALCKTVAGDALGHTWKPATCTTPKMCTECDTTIGKALGHDWKAATCEKAKTCAVCEDTEGKALGHDWKAATCTRAKSCKECGVREGSSLGHDWRAATCTTIKTCKECGDTEGKALGHVPGAAATCTTSQKCDVCQTQLMPASGHIAGAPEVTKATATADGSIVTKCSGCGDVMNTEIIKAAGKVSLSKTSYTYTGKKVKAPKVVVKDAEGNTISSSEYKVTTPKNVQKMKAIGKYTWTVTFTGEKYTGVQKVSMEIKPAKTTIKVPVAAKKAITVKWKKGKKTQVTGYEILLATNKNFTKGTKTVTVKGFSKTSEKVTKLKAKAKYFVKVRTYKTVKGVKIYSDWSKVKTIKTK